MRIDVDHCERARQARDPRFDGRFFVAVKTTGIYCRPTCKVRIPLLRNVRFLPTAAACEAAGFRPCKRCRPETAPGTPAWTGASAVVSRALRVLQQEPGAAPRVEQLAERVGIGERQLRRLFAEHVGASPAAVARTARAHLARRLIDETDWPLARIATAAGFGSVRQFNDAIRERFGDAPSRLRKRRPRRDTPVHRSRTAPALPPAVLLRGDHRLPRPARASGHRGDRGNGQYRRTLIGAEGPAELVVRDLPDRHALLLSLDGASPELLWQATRAVRRVFDLDADPVQIQSDLGDDPLLRRRIDAHPGLRLPGAFDPFESIIRTVLGQQVSVKGATTLAGRLIETFGDALDGGRRTFPRPERLAEADLATIGLPESRAEALRAVSRATASGALDWSGASPADEVCAELRALPGIGEWTAQVVAMRALANPDAFPAGDLGIRKALAKKGAALPSEREVLARAGGLATLARLRGALALAGPRRHDTSQTSTHARRTPPAPGGRPDDPKPERRTHADPTGRHADRHARTLRRRRGADPRTLRGTSLASRAATRRRQPAPCGGRQRGGRVPRGRPARLRPARAPAARHGVPAAGLGSAARDPVRPDLLVPRAGRERGQPPRRARRGIPRTITTR